MEPERRRAAPTTFVRKALPFKTQRSGREACQEAPPKGQGLSSREASHRRPEPRKEHFLQYRAPLLSEQELAQIAVPFEGVSSDLESVIAEHGFAVVTDVVPPSELHMFEDDFLQDLLELVDEDALPAVPDSVRRSYNRLVAEGPYHFPLQTALRHLTRGTGLCLDYCLPHGRFAWRARMHPRVHAVFKALFPYSGDLVTSLGAPLFTPGGQQAAEQSPTTAHVDMNKHDSRPGTTRRSTYQGMLYIWPAAASTSATVVWPGSHLAQWPEIMRDSQVQLRGVQGLNYSELSQMLEGERAVELLRGWGAHARRVPVPAGALLLWDQRTVHAGWRGGPRLAQAVCLEPAERRTEADRVAKLRLAALGLPGCHWASVGIQHDMCLDFQGAFACQAVAAEEGPGSDPDAAVLPLRPCIRPLPLDGRADLGALRGLVQAEFTNVGVWEPVPGGQLLLEASVREDFQRIL